MKALSLGHLSLGHLSLDHLSLGLMCLGHLSLGHLSLGLMCLGLAFKSLAGVQVTAAAIAFMKLGPAYWGATVRNSLVRWQDDYDREPGDAF